MIKSGFLLMCCFLILQSATSQKMEYDIVKGDKIIGSVLAEKRVINDTTVITITSEARFKLLFSFNVSYLLEEKFVDKVLVTGMAANYLNEKVQKESTVKKNAENYVVRLDNKETIFDLSKITYSISNLYFEQPPELDITIFSQQFSDFLVLNHQKDAEYILISPNGNNEYYYNDGKLKKVKISRTYATFYFILKE